jgi:hypothetical protein
VGLERLFILVELSGRKKNFTIDLILVLAVSFLFISKDILYAAPMEEDYNDKY